uniref:Uncharacterized protein n=3 Tax=Schizophyllum commune (strain H4-8 / FGSC 9210) TaxID=578458 RepID=D8Q251_SCHCM
MTRDVAGGVFVPFWKSLPFTDIHAAITPDVLHQLYQGVLKHLIAWCNACMSPDELDRRIRTLPPTFGVRHFSNGLSALSQISGSERKQMAKILLGCLVGIIAPSGIKACRGLLDFIYYAQYSSHDDQSLREMQAALDAWETNKQYFISAEVRSHLNIPKFHSLLHYVESIRLLGSTDNYNTEMFERLHIDFAKKGWRASNKRDAFPQMTAWLERQEKIAAFETFIDATVPSPPSANELALPSKAKNVAVRIAKHPNKVVTLASIEATHNAPGFSARLKQYLNTLSPHPTTAARALAYDLPFKRVNVVRIRDLRESTDIEL